MPRTCVAIVIVLAAVGIAEEPKVGPAAVDMALSFRIPQPKENGISHTPSVVFTKDGARMLTVTSEGRVVVFDATTRKMLREVRLPEPATNAVAVDPAGRRVAWTLKAGGVAVLDVATGKIVAQDPKLKASWLAVSPDGRRLAVTVGTVVQVRDLATLKDADTVAVEDAVVTNVTWSRDGTRLAWTTEDGRVVVRDPGKREPVYAARKQGALHAVAFGPKGARVAYGGHDKRVYQYTFATKTEEVIAKQQPFWITCLGYSPDGSRLAVGDESCDIWLFAVDTKARLFHNKHHVECWLNSVAWAPDGKTFLFGCRPNSHAGRPHIHGPLRLAEAARSGRARSSRATLLSALDAEIAREKDGARRTALARYRQTVAREEKVRGHAAGVLATDEDVELTYEFDVMTKIPESHVGVPPPDLPDGLRRLIDEHRKALHEELKALGSQFCVNQWKVK